MKDSGKPQGGSGWDDPIPLGPPPPPDLPLDGLPSWLRAHIESVAEATAAPADMALLLGITAVSTAVMNKGRVLVKPGYTEPLQIWTASVVPPGGRKSPVFSHLMRPIWEYEEGENRRYRADFMATKDERDIVEEAYKQAKKKASRALVEGEDEGYQGAVERADDLRKRLADLEIRVPDVITISDITSEALGQLMGEHFGRAAIVSPEGDIFNIMAGLYRDGNVNLQTFKKGWTGDEAITDERVGRQGTRVARPALVVGLTIQPSVLSSLTKKEQFRGEGLLGRFLFAQPDARIGYRPTGDAVPGLDQDAVARYKEGLRLLLDSNPAGGDADGWVPHELLLSPEAAELRDAFAAVVEHSVRPGEDMDGMEDWGTKLVGNMVRVAGLIHLSWQVEEKRELWGDPISGRAMEAAVSLGGGLIGHARYVLDSMDALPEIHLARYVLRRIMTYGDDKPLTKRELHRRCHGRKDFQRAGDLDNPLSLLEKHHFVRFIPQPSTGGRSPSPLIELNPQVRAESDTSDRSPGEAEAAPRAAVEAAWEDASGDKD